MARMLEALRKMKRLPPPAERILRAPKRPPENDSDSASEDETLAHSSAAAVTATSGVHLDSEDGEIPFIEVGGRGAPFDASPCVLAATPKTGFPTLRFQSMAEPAVVV